MAGILFPTRMVGVCSACTGNSDKQTDTVKISFVLPADAADKENAVPELACITTKEAEKAEEEARRRAEEEEEQRRQEERQRLEAMEKRRREEEEEQRRQAEEAERRRLEEERLRRQREEEEELARQQREEEERREAEKRDQVKQFLAKNGFASVNDKKKKGSLPLSGSTYPLHVAVKAADPQTVRVLLWAGADRNLKDSSKLTPLELARKLHKNGSQADVIEALSA